MVKLGLHGCRPQLIIENNALDMCIECLSATSVPMYMHTCMQTCIHTCPQSVPTSSSGQADEQVAFRFEDGVRVWNDIVGAKVEGNNDAKLPESSVRIHIGAFKALVSSVQREGRKRFAVCLGPHWKGAGASSLWRATSVIVSSNWEALLTATEKQLSDPSSATFVLGAIVMDYSTSELRVDQPDTFAIEWLHHFSKPGKLCQQFVVGVASIGEAQPRGPMQFFQHDADSKSFTKVYVPFLTKRLANETFHFFDADMPKRHTSLSDMVNELVSEAWSETICKQLNS